MLGILLAHDSDPLALVSWATLSGCVLVAVVRLALADGKIPVDDEKQARPFVGLAAFLGLFLPSTTLRNWCGLGLGDHDLAGGGTK